jgi:hypothetical protein
MKTKLNFSCATRERIAKVKINEDSNFVTI